MEDRTIERQTIATPTTFKNAKGMSDSNTSPVSGRATRQSKIEFGAVYDRDDPSFYFSTLKPLAYRTPATAAPIFRRCIGALRKPRGVETVTVLDLCCGYGANAALVNHRLTMDDLYARYRKRRRARPAEERLRADRAWFAAQARQPMPARFIGVDAARHALDYAQNAGLLDTAIAGDFEHEDPDAEQRRTIARADLITVTGGMSYIGSETFARVLGAFPAGCKPWIAIFPLRHLDMRPLAAVLRRHGLVLEPWAATAFPHRRFVDRTERAELTAALNAAINSDADPVDRPPAKDWIEAVFYLARPERERELVPIELLVEDKGARRAAELRERLTRAV
jgi:SAM-dependent methyltransferase